MKKLSLVTLMAVSTILAACGGRSGNTTSGRGAANSQANIGSSQTSAAETPTPQPTPDPAEAVRKLTTDLGAALSSGNPDQLETILSDGYVHINDLGQLVTKPDIIGGVRDGSVRFTSVNIQEVNARVYGDAAVVTANFMGTNAANGGRSNVEDRVTLVAAREGDRWRFVSGQTTPIHAVPQRGGGSGGASTGSGPGGAGGIMGSGGGSGSGFGTGTTGSSPGGAGSGSGNGGAGGSSGSSGGGSGSGGGPGAPGGKR